MRLVALVGLAASLIPSVAQAACSGPLTIDDFSQYSSNSNSLGSWTSDDGSMTSISAAGNKLSFTPSSDSYFYETFSCQAASSNGYDSISFSTKGPAGGSFTLEIQTQASCSASSYTSYYHEVTGLTGQTQTITIPLSSFAGANADAVTAFLWSDFSSTSATYELSNIQFGCSSSGGGNPPTTSQTSMRTTSRSTVPTGSCQNLLVDDWVSQSRLTFLYYNAMLNPSSDDATMNSVVVSPTTNRLTLTPKDDSSYFYSQVGCLNARDVYGGLSLRIKAPSGTTLSVELDSASECGGEATAAITVSSSDLGWTFDGSEKLYSIPFSKFSGLDTSKLTTILFAGLNNAVTFGPLAFYCGNTVSEYTPTNTAVPTGISETVAAPSGTAAAIVIDQFANSESNALGFWHGADEGMTLNYGGNSLTITSNDADYAYYTQVTATCRDLSSYDGDYLHIAYSGSNAFSVALQQHNSQCNENIAPYPETWDSVEAARYASGSDIYIPMNHFKIERSRVVGVALKGFYKADPVTLSKIEIVKSVPAGFTIPNKLESGNLIFACKRPNSFAFAIDDGDPTLAQEVLQIIREEDIKVTFFTVGAPLLDASTNLSNVYNEMKAAGHQIALHSYTHPKMEGLPDYAAIDWEYENDIAAVEQTLGGFHTPYFRPPFGTEGARMRQRLAVATADQTSSPYIINWSVDVEDWLWAETSTPEKQLDAFQRDVDKGGNLVVMHYLYPSTVGYLRQFIQIAKATGKQLMRVDQCLEDPNAPAL
ncbi:carbohydrate esterase family 4 protein [Aplosporella prunicola CBS 121167]|uniref:Carbohydrate esterase family 4 protein n=1 Tax=Aplosporella prunicola CBS 121167 TaxID=1176127 RepID=A0A6A6BBK8_9PEZI|nr:carbohydrate esterase family 4 protein [Aplosporella prunicola CBS 121167]KAF2140743.1 carbohydrate esterase family 4 protein [Aplosporella prunicola CBS 121167]